MSNKTDLPPTFSCVSPRGTAMFPRLNTPEIPPYEGYDGPPLYSVTLRVPDEDAADLRQKIDDLFDENLAGWKEEKGARKVKAADTRGYEPEYARDDEGNETDELTGFTLFKFKLPSVVTSRKTGKSYDLKPALYDAKGHPMTEEITGGSTIKVKLEARGWYMGGTKMAGVKLSVDAVQVLKLAQGGGSRGTFDGFDVEDDGFDATEKSDGFQDETTEAGAAGGDY